MNITIFYFLNNLTSQNKFFDEFAVFIAQDFGYLLLVVALLFFLFHKKNEKGFLENWQYKAVELICVFGTIFFAWILGFIIKNITRIPRPFVSLEGVNQLIEKTGFSFPSGHATLFSALAVVIYLFNKKIGIVFGIGAVLIGLSRIVVGVHYPVDILAGIMLGGLTAWIIASFLKKKFKSLTK